MDVSPHKPLKLVAPVHPTLVFHPSDAVAAYISPVGGGGTTVAPMLILQMYTSSIVGGIA